MAKTYTTVQGDVWDAIARKQYGTEKAMNVLLEANQDYKDTVVFSAGIVLTLPEYTAPSPDALPPWRR